MFAARGLHVPELKIRMLPEYRRRQRLRLTVIAVPTFLAVFAGGMLVTRSREVPVPTNALRPLSATASHSASTNRFTCTVTRVHDGDGPIYCAEGPKIRLTAVAARELDETCNTGHPCPTSTGAQAKAALSRLAQGQTLSCEATGASYSRTTAWCWLPDGRELNCEMVRSGTALRWAKFDPGNDLCS
jgi:endonuclease YncB( thermonuclease family)